LAARGKWALGMYNAVLPNKNCADQRVLLHLMLWSSQSDCARKVVYEKKASRSSEVKEQGADLKFCHNSIFKLLIGHFLRFCWKKNYIAVQRERNPGCDWF
jgi:hypothetical protein